MNIWKRSAIFSLEIPIPVSRTRTAMRPWGSPPIGGAHSMKIVMEPCGVNLIALSTRLTSTWRKRSGSPETRSGPAMWASKRSSIFFSVARGPSRRSTSCTDSTGANGNRSRRSFPFSILVRSSTSLISEPSRRPSLMMVVTKPRWDSSRRDSASRLAKPITALSGVRISWLITARKSPLAWLASSAACLACRSCRPSSACARSSARRSATRTAAISRTMPVSAAATKTVARAIMTDPTVADAG